MTLWSLLQSQKSKLKKQSQQKMSWFLPEEQHEQTGNPFSYGTKLASYEIKCVLVAKNTKMETHTPGLNFCTQVEMFHAKFFKL